MKELVQQLVQQLGVEERQARGGAAVLFNAARDKLGSGEFERLLGGVPGLDSLLRDAPASGGLGKLFGGLAGALGGGNAALFAKALAQFNALGLTQKDAERFVPVILGFLRERVGARTVATLEQALRA